jgi:hypothetical protein
MELRTAARNPLKKGLPSADSRQEMESKINLAQVAPINYKVTAALVNQFVVSTTQFLNRFVTRCDRKLHQVAAKMCRIQVRFNTTPSRMPQVRTRRPAIDAAVHERLCQFSATFLVA